MSTMRRWVRKARSTMSKRFLSVLMSFVLCIGLMPLPAFAGDSEGALVASGSNLAAQVGELPKPTNVKVAVTDVQQGTMQADGYGPIAGNVATLAVTLDKQSGANQYFICPLKRTAPGSNYTSFEKVAEGTMPTVHAELGQKPTFETIEGNVEVGPNGEKITETDTTITVEKKVVLLDKDPQSPLEEQACYKKDDSAVVEVQMLNIKETQSGYDIKQSEPVRIEFLVSRISKGRTFTEEGEEPSPEAKNVALAKMVTSDGKTTASQTVSWPKSQASIAFRPGSLAGYSVSPAEHVFTKDGEIFTFTYTPTQSVEAVTDVTVTVNYLAPAGYQAPASKKATGQPGANYQIDTPEVKGLFPSQRTVAGQFGTTNQTITVSYGGMEMIDEHVVAVPAGNVYTYNGHFQEGVPAHAGYKPRAGSINHARLPGVYQVMLELSAGYRWADGSTDPKMVTWAIDKAPLSSMVLDRTRFDTAQDLAQKPNVVRVIANGIVVPQGAYSVTYSNPTAEQPGIYSVSVKATDSSFTGTLTETYGITETHVLACPHHGEKVNYMSNGDGATHDEECAYCGKVLGGRDHQPCTFDKVGAKVVDNIDPSNQNSGKPTGQVFLVCSKCNQGKAEFETCQHEGTRAFRDNGDGNHIEYCTRCGLDLFTEAHEMVDEAVKTPVGNGSGQTAVAYQGIYAHKCSKCSYQELKQCTHEKTHVVRISGGDYEQHDIYCDLCKAPVGREKCSNFKRTCMNSSTHSKTCAECGSVHGYFGHDWQRQITKVDAIPRACKTSAWLNPNKLFFTYYDYRIHYTETCKQCKAKRVGAYLYKTNDINGSFNYKKAFQSLVNMSSEDLKNVHSIWEGGGSYLLPVGNALVEPLMSTLQPVTALVGWDSVEYASLDFTQLVNWEGSTESPGDGYKLYTADGKLVESAKVPGDVPNPAWSVEGGSGTQAQGLQAQEVLPEPVDGADNVPDLDGATEVYVTVGSNLLRELSDGTHTLAVCGLLENGERACSVMEFTIETVETDDGDRKAIKDLHPLGASVDAEGDVVNVQLSTDTVAYTDSAVVLPTVAVTKSKEGAEGGMEPLPQDAYTLTYYRINDVDGEPGAEDQVPVNPAAIVEPGSYCVVATPAGENPGWSGTAFANFRVARTFESSNAMISLDFDHATYTGAEIEPAVTVTVNGEAQPLAQSYAYTSSEEGEGDGKYTSLTQSGGGDYTVQYKDNVEVGTATVIVKGDGLWEGTLEATFAIEPAPTPANMLTELTLSQTSFAYNGTAQSPSVAHVKAGDTEVTPADYSVDFEKIDSTEPGTYQVTVRAEEGGDFQGLLTASYTIHQASLTSVELKSASAAYTGAAHNPIKEVKAGSLSLAAGDYTLEYKDAAGNRIASIVNPGTYTITATGKGKFTGSKSAAFTVTPALLTSIELNSLSVAYTGAAHNPVKEVKAGSLKLGAADNTLVYKDASGKRVSSIVGAGTYTVTATGKGNFTGSKSATYTVTKAKNPIKSKVSGLPSLKYNTSAQTFKSPFSVSNALGNVTYAMGTQSKYFTVNAATGKVTAKAKTPVGSYKVTIKATAKGNANYKSGTTSGAFTVKVNKAANPIKVIANTCSVKYNKKKASTIAVKKAFKITKAQGKLTFKKASGDSKVTINKNGKVTVAKATKKGKHTIKVNVKAAGNKNYVGKTVKKVKLTVTVKQ